MIDFRTLKGPARLAGFLTLLFLVAGFCFSLYYEYLRSGMSREGTETKLLGDGSEFSSPMAHETMVAISHPHMTMVPLMLVAMILPVCLNAARSSRVQYLIVLLTMGGYALGMSSHWLMRYCGDGWYWTMPAAGITMTLGALGGALLGMWDLACPGRDQTAA